MRNLAAELRSSNLATLLRAVQAAETEISATRQHGFRVKADFFFVDREQLHIDFLRSELEASEFKDAVGRTIHLARDEFEKRAAAIITAIRRRRPYRRGSLR